MIETNIIHKGLCLDVMKTFPDECIDCVITSPAYWQLRDYGFSAQWGLENTFEEYLEHLWEWMDETKRVLKSEGTVWVNLGDTYGGSKKGNTSNKGYIENEKSGDGISKSSGHTKSLLLLPHRFAIGCSGRGWILRNDCIWAKKNAMPESVTDRFSKKHEFIFLMAKNKKYYFDLESIKDRTITKDNSKRDRDNTKLNNTPGRTKMGGLKENNYTFKNPGSVSDFWDITTKGSSENHYAAYNSQLIDKPILAGCPKNGIILDPFCGTATTGVRARQLNRNFIGIEGSDEFYDIAMKNFSLQNNQAGIFDD